jgi:phage terminase large subunit GpA-like protein
MDGETWGIEYVVMYGNTEQPTVYQEMDTWAQRKFRHASGHYMWPACICIDAAFKSEAVYRYVKKCGGRKVFATRGDRGFAPLGSNWVDRSKSDNDRLWILKIDGCKESLYSRLRILEPGAGYQHFPSNPKCHYDIRYFQQLTSEVLRISPSGQRYFAKPTGETRNEALDVRVLGFAGVEILDPNYNLIKRKLEGKPPNDWRAKQEEKKELLAMPIPDLRNTDPVVEKSEGDVAMNALRSSLVAKAPKWMNIGR